MVLLLIIIVVGNQTKTHDFIIIMKFKIQINEIYLVFFLSLLAYFTCKPINVLFLMDVWNSGGPYDPLT